MSLVAFMVFRSFYPALSKRHVRPCLTVWKSRFRQAISLHSWSMALCIVSTWFLPRYQSTSYLFAGASSIRVPRLHLGEEPGYSLFRLVVIDLQSAVHADAFGSATRNLLFRFPAQIWLRCLSRAASHEIQGSAVAIVRRRRRSRRN